MDKQSICVRRQFHRFAGITLPGSLFETRSIVNRKAALMKMPGIKTNDGNKENAPLYPDKIEKEVY